MILPVGNFSVAAGSSLLPSSVLHELNFLQRQLASRECVQGCNYKAAYRPMTGVSNFTAVNTADMVITTCHFDQNFHEIIPRSPNPIRQIYRERMVC